MRLGDLASLAFCNAWSDPQVLGPWTLRLSDGRQLLLEPNPFVYDVPIEVEARELAPGPYRQRRGAAGGMARRPEVAALRRRRRPGAPHVVGIAAAGLEAVRRSRSASTCAIRSP